MVKRVEQANGTAEVITSDPNGHARPYTLEVTGPWGISCLGEHLYDGSGNLVKVGLGTDNRYDYDGVGRLQRFGMDSGQWQVYDCDPYGNMTSLRHHNGSSTTTCTFAVDTATNRLSVANRYAYIQNNPTNLVDPDGLVAGPTTFLLQTLKASLLPPAPRPRSSTESRSQRTPG